MPRLPVIDPATATGRAKELFDGPLKGKELNIFKGMANSPAVLDAYLAMSGALNKGSLNAKEREVVQLAIGQANGCPYCLAAHTKLGTGAGLTEDQCLAARRGSMPDDAKLDAVVKFALSVHEKRGQVADADIDAFCAAGYSPAHVAEVVAAFALASFTNHFNLVNDTQVDFPAVPAI